MSASEALRASVVARLKAALALAVYDAPPVQAAFPYALVETGAESDWGHKSGAGRELRLALSLRDAGERPVRLRALIDAVEAALAEPPEAEGWQIVTFAWLRSRTVRDGRAPAPVEWSGLVEYRARMLALPPGGG
ncbi:MAG: DUF3168 domain-containing protein [Allosphingosinicella sp.]